MIHNVIIDRNATECHICTLLEAFTPESIPARVGVVSRTIVRAEQCPHLWR